MVKRTERLAGDAFEVEDDSQDPELIKMRQTRSQSPFKGFDPFHDSEIPKGVFFPTLDRRSEHVPCTHLAGTRREQCSNGIWDRVICAKCGKLLELVDC